MAKAVSLSSCFTASDDDDAFILYHMVVVVVMIMFLPGRISLINVGGTIKTQIPSGGTGGNSDNQFKCWC